MLNNKIISMALAFALVVSQSSIIFATEGITDTVQETAAQEFASQTSVEEMLESGEYADGELLAVFSDNMTDSEIEDIVAEEAGECVEIIDTRNYKTAQIEISEGSNMEDVMESLIADSEVQYVQPNYRYTVAQTDTYLDKENRDYQYQFDKCNIFAAWDELYKMSGRSKVKVAIIDTGVDVTHSDLQKNLKHTDYYMRTMDGKRVKVTKDSGEHGTHVSGIIGATYGNGKGGSGVASGYSNDLIEMYVAGVSRDGQYIFTRDIIGAIDYCIDEKVNVINMSFGAEERDYVMEAWVKKAYDKGIVMVAASGNEGTSVFNSPASFKEVISVNATNIYDEPTYFSNFGLWTDISTPGKSIMSTRPGNRYQLMDGTSMASPVAAGIAALILCANKNLTPAQVYNIMCASSRKPFSGTFDEDYGYGIADAKAAVAAAKNASEDVEVSKIYIKEKTAKIRQYEDISLETLVTPATCLKDVHWSSDNPNIAIVDGSGKVTGIAEGTCIIKAAAGGKSVSCTVEVKAAVKPSSVTIRNKDKLNKLTVGQYIKLTAKVTPADATNAGYYFESTDNKIVGIDDDGMLNALSPGTCTLIVRTNTGSVSDSVLINVKPAAYDVNITSRVSVVKVGDKNTWKAKLLVKDNKATNDEIRWYSTDPGVASVNRLTGEVKAVSPGVAYIQAITSSTESDTVPIGDTKKITVGKKSYKSSSFGLKTASKSYNSVKISWKKIPIASKYVVYRAASRNGKYRKITTLTKTSAISFIDKKLTCGKTYYYKVKAIYKDGTALGTSAAVKAVPKPAAPAKVTLKASKKQIKISFSKVAGASGYKIYRAEKKKGKYKLVRSTTKRTFTDKKLTSGKRYYYKVRAYRNVNKKAVDGKYSAVHSAKVK